MIFRSLDSNGDWQFGRGRQNYLTDNVAIAKNIETRLLSFFNDCFFDLKSGVDWIRLLGSKSTDQEIILSCRAVILQSYGVVRVNQIEPELRNSLRSLSLNYNIDTIFTSQFSQTLGVLTNA